MQSLSPTLLLHLFVSSLSFGLDLQGLATPFICHHLLALDEALVGIGVILLFLLLLKQFLNKIILLLLLV